MMLPITSTKGRGDTEIYRTSNPTVKLVGSFCTRFNSYLVTDHRNYSNKSICQFMA